MRVERLATQAETTELSEHDREAVIAAFHAADTPSDAET